MSPALSIVIPAFNVEAYIADAISSALAQTFRDIEVIVVDDGSTDGTPGIVAGFDNPRLRVIRQENRGLSAARNTGIAAAHGRYVGLLDGDDRWYPRKAERQLAVMEADPGIVVTFCHSVYIDERGAETGRVLMTGPARPGLRDLVLRNVLSNGSTPIVRADGFLRAGLFDTALRSCEDWEMWVRLLRETGGAAVLVPELLTAYRINTQSLSFDFAKFLHNARLASAKMRAETPGLSDRLFARGLGMCYRIAGSKALKIDDRKAALRLFGQALRIAPELALVDPRLAASLASMILPDAVTDVAHRVVARRAGLGQTDRASIE